MRRDRVFLFDFSAPWLIGEPPSALPGQGFVRIIVKELSLGHRPSAETIARDAVAQAKAKLRDRPLHLERGEVLKEVLGRWSGHLFEEHPLLKKRKVPITRPDM